MFKSIAAVAAAFLLSAPAAALTYTFDLNGSGTAYGGSGGGNSIRYKQTQGSGRNKITVNMRVSAWSWDGTTLRQSALGVYDQGLGVISGDDQGGAGNQHTIDNQNRFDFILLQFDRNVQLTSVVANAFSLGGSIDNDLTVGRSVSVGSSWDVAPTGWNNKAVSDMDSLFQAQRTIDSQNIGSALLTARQLDIGSTITGKVWMISASLSNQDKRIDAFKLDTLKVQTNTNMGLLGAVPEPATWAMMIGGFGLVGAAARRRKTALLAN